LADYDVMLFPTFHEGEGFPGVLIDAAFAGLPAIVTAWHANAEVITDGVNGYVVPVHNPEAIAEKLIYLADNPEMLMHLREGARQSANRYDSAVVVPQLLQALEKKGWTLHAKLVTKKGGLN
jgi:glycosyltransferase involved in cell wall biosynthesis